MNSIVESYCNRMDIKLYFFLNNKNMKNCFDSLCTDLFCLLRRYLFSKMMDISVLGIIFL